MKKILYLSLCLSFLLWLAFPFTAFILSEAGYTIFIGTRGSVFLIQCLLNTLAAWAGAALALLHYRKSPGAAWNKAVFLLTAAGAAVLLLCGNTGCRLLDSCEEYHSFSSPDGAHSIVIRENVSLISGQVALFERINPFLISRRDSFVTDDGYRPVCAGEYVLEWQDNAVILTAADGAGGWKTVSVPLGTK